MLTATRASPSWSARSAARPWRRTDGWPVGSRSISIFAPADAAHAEAEDLADGFLRGPAAGERLGAPADVAGLGGRQDPRDEPVAESIAAPRGSAPRG